MPSARFAPDGELGVTISSTRALDRYNLHFQALPWLETVFRYARVDNYSADGDLYDRSLSFKIRLVKETAMWPNIAVGVQDILGTGVFGSEYLVASKQLGNFDFTLGVGWRRFGGVAQFNNPIGYLFSSFKVDSFNFGEGGTPRLKSYFHGSKAGLFGGIAWHTPIDGLSVIAELSGDRFTRQRQYGGIDVKIPVNVGLSYEPWEGMQIGGGYFYGSQFGLRVTLHMNAFDEQPKPRLGTQPLPMHVRTPPERKDAVLAMVQNRTNYYDVSPWQSASILPKKVARPVPPSPEPLADALYSRATFRNLTVEGIETYGSSLIITTSNSDLVDGCGQLASMAASVRAAGFDQIVLTSGKTSSVKICNSRPVITAGAHSGANIVFASAKDEVPAAPLQNIVESQTVEQKIIAAAKQQRIGISAISIGPHQIDIGYVNGSYRTDSEALGRLLRVLMANAPDNAELFRLTDVTSNLPTNTVTIARSDVERTVNLFGTASELRPLTEIEPMSQDDPFMLEHSLQEFPKFGFSVTPGYRQSLFDPVNPFLLQVYANVGAGVSLTRHLSVAGSFEVNLYNTFTNSRKSNSLLPHVRSDFAEYYTHGITGLSSLSASYYSKLTPQVYMLARAGYLENMYAGFGAEVLWQPPHKRWSVGAALYAVQQRAFNRLFGLRDYRVVTGHVSLYYDSPFYGLDFAVHAGRYLARDYGATFQITRRFDNGIEIGAYATLTNVPFAKYGEGSFDKGFIIRIPVDALAPVYAQDVVNLDFSPLTRDGGQRLEGEQSLHNLLRRSTEGELLATWEGVLNP